MNQIRWKLTEELNAEPTYGHITKKRRKELNLEKTHRNDAFVIAGANGNEERCEPYEVTHQKRNNRKLQVNRNSHGRSVRKKKYDIQPKDLIQKREKIRESKGVFSYGRYVRIDDEEEDYWKVKEVEIVKYGQGLQFKSIHPPPKIKDLRKGSS
ncbi:hypothetical protein [Methanonatronarchaeum sp. AMET6-2]|uniref:hypothetical protein n=1 Tax=Methanonatronarchaeum sp. AMET6-2 TaxID=2933293 RepID=UPI00120BEF53|nr:hypothetical protein [Methanonatronarchaeum sp. AMET6-2]RZN62811.1 MAG: hypothetical protein EF811_01930 [Methanonatronarchaeia archaeon]UOY10140.1 hypothetical protein MU439_00425 [Methanonatronarchaeum sp. AMET6-2]